MTTVVLFHHALGRTEGFLALAERLRGSGHEVHTPDLFEGRVFDSVKDGVAHVGDLGAPVLFQRARAAIEGLPPDVVHAGVSLGVVVAQFLAQGRPGRGALLIEACVPPSEFDRPWPAELPTQIHGMADDSFFAREGDLDVARALVARSQATELFVYPGDAHLFADPALPSYDAVAAALLHERAAEFLDRLDHASA